MIKMFSLILLFVSVLISRSACAGIFDFTRTAALMLGKKENKVLAQAEYILGRPKQIFFVFHNTPDEVEVRRYIFTFDDDIALYFHNDVFIEGVLLEPNSNNFPPIRKDFRNIDMVNDPKLGFVILKDGKTLTITTLYKKDKSKFANLF